ncbi:MAG: hypothetical protein PUC01_00310 [Spirochaetales bacterium]|nr:hypothetical protein [Spirochaetales bacterium]
MRFNLLLDKKYLVLPYTYTATPREVGFFKEEGEVITSLLLEYDENPTQWVYLSSSLFKEEKILIEADETLKALIKTSDEKPQEKKHFSFHYTPSFGWINDPNGLHFKDGIYHMYYQANPVSKKWNNMSWGHAISKDLVNFKEQDPVFLPKDDKWVIFSGSALNGEFAYTVANIKGERKFFQERRFSEDGFNFTNSEVIIPNFVEDERDPRLFIYKGKKYLLLWLEKNTFALYSDNYGSYELVNKFEAKDAWECPDIYCINDRLFFTSADGFYFEAQIDDSGLKLIGERKNMFLTKLNYASQSFTGLDDTYMVSWLRVETPHLNTTGAMSIIRKVGLIGDNLTLEPNEDLLKHFKANGEYHNTYSSEENALYLVTEGSFTGDIQGQSISYDSSLGKLIFGTEEVIFNSHDNKLNIFIDEEIIEISNSTYQELSSFEIKDKNVYHKGVRISSSNLKIKEFIWR